MNNQQNLPGPQASIIEKCLCGEILERIENGYHCEKCSPTPKIEKEIKIEEKVIPQKPENESISPPMPLPQKEYDKKVHGRRFSVAHKLAIKALKDSNMSAEQLEPIAGISGRTIRRIWEDEELNDLSPRTVTTIKSGLGGLFYKRALGAALTITPEKLAESSALQLATVAGIMTEKGRLMEGLSTENVSFRGVAANLEADREKIAKRLEELGE